MNISGKQIEEIVTCVHMGVESVWPKSLSALKTGKGFILHIKKINPLRKLSDESKPFFLFFLILFFFFQSDQTFLSLTFLFYAIQLKNPLSSLKFLLRFTNDFRWDFLGKMKKIKKWDLLFYLLCLLISD